MTTVNVNWNDDALRKAMRQAIANGINIIAAECVKDAKENVPIVTAVLDGSIGVWEPAMPDDDIIQAVWGSREVHYALGIELGDRSLIPTQSALPRRPARGTPRNTGRSGFLRGAADKHYPNLAKQIAAELSK